MNRKSDRAGVPRLSMLMLMSAVVLATVAIGFILADSGDIPDSEGATSGSCGDDLTWTIDSEGNLKIEGSGPMYDYSYSSTRWGANTVRSVVIGDSVTSIGNRAFYGCTALTSVTISDSVISIGEWAFFRCTSLETITIPDSVTTIGQLAFQGCTSLESVTIGNSLESVASQAFDGCTSLTSVTIGNSVTSIEEFAFQGCTSLRSIVIPDSVISIGGDAFSRCTSLTSVTIGNSVESIGWFAFEVCTSLESVTIGNSVESIETGAFFGCTSLTGFDVSGSNASFTALEGILYDKDKTALVQYPAGRTDQSFSVPSSVTSIGACAFAGNTFLTSITIGDSVQSIGDGAFAECTSITGFDVSGSNACFTALDGILYDKDKTALVQYPVGSTETTFSIPDSVESIGDYAFSCSESLISVTIPDSVTSIGNNAFAGSASITSIAVPDSVTSIGWYAFLNCTSLGSVTIEGAVESIRIGTFIRCTSLASIEIPDSVTSIEFFAFGDCTSLTKVTIPSSVTTIEPYAFNTHVFYDTDGVTVLETAASNLAGYTFKGETVERMIKQGSEPSTGHSVTYDIDGGTGAAPEGGQYAEGETFILPAYDGTKDGYIFAGWMFGDIVYDEGDTVTMISKDMEFVAVWNAQMVDLEGEITGYIEFVEGQMVTVDGLCTLTDGSEVVVLGKLVIPAGSVLVIGAGALMHVAEAEVAGALAVLEQGSFAADTVTLSGAGTMVAATGSDATVGVMNAEAGASVSGEVAVTGQIFASATASIDGRTTEGLRSTTYHLADEALLVVYDATGSCNIRSVDVEVPVENAYFDGTWNDTDGEKVADDAVIGSPADVYADVEYGIYDVIIKADAGINKVYLNGIAMSKGYVTLDGYTFEASFTQGLTAGSYKVTCTLKAGYTGTATLYIDGFPIADSTITASGTPSDANHIRYVGILSANNASGEVDPPTPDTGCSSEIVMGMRTTSDGNVKVILAADDGKAIPSGTVTVTMSYAKVDEYGIWDIDSVRITADVEYTGDGYQVIAVTLTDNEYYPYATGLVASFTDGNGTYDSNKLQFTPLSTAR